MGDSTSKVEHHYFLSASQSVLRGSPNSVSSHPTLRSRSVEQTSQVTGARGRGFLFISILLAKVFTLKSGIQLAFLVALEHQIPYLICNPFLKKGAHAACFSKKEDAYSPGTAGNADVFFFLSQKKMEWNGMEWNGMEWNGMEWNGMEWNGIE